MHPAPINPSMTPTQDFRPRYQNLLPHDKILYSATNNPPAHQHRTIQTAPHPRPAPRSTDESKPCLAIPNPIPHRHPNWRRTTGPQDPDFPAQNPHAACAAPSRRVACGIWRCKTRLGRRRGRGGAGVGCRAGVGNVPALLDGMLCRGKAVGWWMWAGSWDRRRLRNAKKGWVGMRAGRWSDWLALLAPMGATWDMEATMWRPLYSVC
jgi:hypothetical protein